MPERTDHNEAMRLADELVEEAERHVCHVAMAPASLLKDAASELRNLLAANRHMKDLTDQALDDVRALTAERDQLRAEVERLRREKANAIDKAGHMLAAGMGLSNCAFNLKQRVGETLSIRDVAALESSQRAWDAAIDAARTTHKETE